MQRAKLRRFLALVAFHACQNIAEYTHGGGDMGPLFNMTHSARLAMPIMPGVNGISVNGLCLAV